MEENKNDLALIEHMRITTKTETRDNKTLLEVQQNDRSGTGCFPILMTGCVTCIDGKAIAASNIACLLSSRLITDEKDTAWDIARVSDKCRVMMFNTWCKKKDLWDMLNCTFTAAGKSKTPDGLHIDEDLMQMYGLRTRLDPDFIIKESIEFFHDDFDVLIVDRINDILLPADQLRRFIANLAVKAEEYQKAVIILGKFNEDSRLGDMQSKAEIMLHVEANKDTTMFELCQIYHKHCTKRFKPIAINIG